MKTIQTNARNFMSMKEIPENYAEFHEELFEAMSISKQAKEDDYNDDDLMFQLGDYMVIGYEFIGEAEEIADLDGLDLNGFDIDLDGFDEDEKEVEVSIGNTFMLGEDIEIKLNSTDRIERPDAVLVELDFTMTNKSEDTVDWVGSTNSFAYQDGIEIEGAMLADDDNEGNIWVGARPGGNVENIKEYFVTNGNDSEVEVILNPGQDWGDEYSSLLIVVE